MAAQKVIKGTVLIAQHQSSCSDMFDQSVILIADHNNSKGSVGFILNKPLNYTLTDLIPEVESQFKIHLGGPLEPESLYFIHNAPHLIHNSIKICENVYWGGDFSLVKDLLHTNTLTNDEIMFFLGYSGWGINQLIEEIEEEHWMLDGSQSSIFRTENTNWRTKILEHNPDLALWIDAPNNPSNN